MDVEFREFGFEYIYTPWWAVLLTLLAVVAIVSIIIISTKSADGTRFRFETRDITYAAVCIAMAYTLSFLGVTLAYGGTITIFSVLPIMIYCYYFGFRKSCIVCTIYMLLQFLQNPYIISPWSALFDYIIPYMALLLVSVFGYKPTKKLADKTDRTNATNRTKNGKQSYSLKNHIPFITGSCLYILVRYSSHVLSGILFFAEYKWENWPLLPYSLAYNSFALVDFAIALAGGILLFLSRSFNTIMENGMSERNRKEHYIAK